MTAETVWSGNYYAANSSVQEGWHKVLEDSLEFRGDESVLDLGCGDGRLTARYAASVPRGDVLGIDNSESMVAWAQEQYRGHRNTSFRVQDITKLSYHRAFDYIVSSNSLHWVPDHQTVIHRIARALRPGGKFALLFCLNESPFRPIHQAIIEAKDSPRWRPYFVGMGKMAFSFLQHDYEMWALESGITSFSTTKIFIDDVFPNLDEFIAWMKGWLHPLERLPLSLHDAFAEEVGFRYLQYTDIQDEQGGVHFLQPLLLVKGAL